MTHLQNIVCVCVCVCMCVGGGGGGGGLGKKYSHCNMKEQFMMANYKIEVTTLL